MLLDGQVLIPAIVLIEMVLRNYAELLGGANPLFLTLGGQQPPLPPPP